MEYILATTKRLRQQPAVRRERLVAAPLGASAWSAFTSHTSKKQITKTVSKKSFSKICVICLPHKRENKSCLSLQLRADSSSEEFTRGGGGGLRLRQGLQVLQVLRSLGLPVLLAQLGSPGSPAALAALAALGRQLLQRR